MGAPINRIIRKILRDKLSVLILITLVCQIAWTPVFYLYGTKEFIRCFYTSLAVSAIYLAVLVLMRQNRIKAKAALTVYTLALEFFCVSQAYYLKFSCGSELVLFAALPCMLLLSTNMSLSKKYLLALDILLIAGIAFITYIKLHRLPPPAIFSREKRSFMIAQEIFYTCSVLSVLLYVCIKTDSALRRYSRKTEFLQEKMSYLAKHDPLTGLMNRARTMEVFEDVTKAKRHDNTDYAIAIFDIDDFKKINDTWGHDAGDYILKTFTKQVWDIFKEPVRISRWGGEEFLIIFPEIDGNTVFSLEDARLNITAKPVVYKENEIPVTATFGLSSSRNFSSPQDVLNDADRCLYIGKQSGKNRIVVSDSF